MCILSRKSWQLTDRPYQIKQSALGPKPSSANSEGWHPIN